MAVATMAAALFATAAHTSTTSGLNPVTINSSPAEQLASYDQRPEVREFIAEMVTKHGFVAEELATIFARARFNPTVARLMMPATSSQPRSWSGYRARFVEPVRIRGGTRFWRENAAALRRATAQYGVPEEIIVGIIGVETVYGRNTGSFRVIDSLSTLAFDYPYKERDRSPFFRAQLEDYLLFARDGNLDVFALRGSYAGAIGIPQFMPGSYRNFAVDFDGDKKIDLSDNPTDAIGSVANYLREHGWIRDQGIFVRTELPDALPASELKRLIDLGSIPALRVDELRKLGFALDPTLSNETLFSLIDLPNEAEGSAATVYVLGTQNFHAITRYNRSYFYAMAVAELAEAVRAQMRP